MGVIPGLLQTAEYAEVVTTVGPLDRSKVEPNIAFRHRRQLELDQRSAPPRQYHVLDEGVIRRHVGIKKDPAIMPTQLRSVADRAERDDLVTVRVIPFEAGAHPGLLDPFILLEFEGGLPDILFLDTDRGGFSMTPSDDPRYAVYAEYFEELLENALPADRSIELIRRVAEEMS